MNNQAADVASRTWDGYRLSKQQEHVLDLADGAHRVVAGVAVRAALDLDLLDRAAHDVAMAHESLRTAYRRVLGENSSVLMVIEEQPRVQVSGCAGDDAALAALVDAEARAEVDGCDLRLFLFTHTDQLRTLVLSAPRLSVDTASVEIFFHDLAAAYASRVDGVAWHREGAVQYADYAQWQFEEGAPTERQRRSAADRAARLAELPPVRLPLALRSTDTRYADLEWTVPAALARRLRDRAAESDSGLRGVLLTGWITALWHATGGPEELAVGTTLTRRPFHEVVSAIGRFECPMPVFAAISAETTLGELLRSVGMELTTGEHADESSMEPAKQHTASVPGFAFSDVAFTAQEALADLWIAPSGDTGKVTLFAQGMDGEIRLRLRYQAEGMAEGGPEALRVCLEAALSALGGDHSVAVRSLAMLDEDAARALIAATNTALPSESPVVHWHRQVEQAARRTPEATALHSDTRTWTYRELDEDANRLANELIARGVRRSSLVGLCMERSGLAIVSMLAIAKAGAGYVPVDPNLPGKRRSAIIAGAGLTHAVATERTAADLPADCIAVIVDDHLTAYAERGTEGPAVDTTDRDPAYVLFTSGSTGTPKGVLVGHGQLAAYLDGVTDRLGLTGKVDSVALSTLGTDLGNTALFPTLISGGQLLVVAPEVSADAQVLAELMASTDYDLLKITPSHLDAVFAVAESPAALMPRKALVVGGEPFGWGSFTLFRDFLGDCALYNHYGPTETTVGVLCGQTTDNALAALTSTVPLGTPMRHARVYVLDANRRPVPVGVPGELWIGGSSVSQGYLSGTAEQHERFVKDPFSPVPDARMYRSGDKARFLPGGAVDFLGRVDRQIKVRGFRVELGEIEAVMRSHPRVTSSLVVEAGESTAAHLVGYLTDVDGTRGSADWIREFLAEHLPEFMIPTHFVALESFPLTSTGKVDSAMLPEPGTYSEESTSYLEPRTPTERRVADVMATLLLRQRAGADDDFFEIGGHSLLATQLIARLREEFDVNVKLRALFENPVVSELAEFIDGLLAEKTERAGVAS
ncbi:non-ribosomal peptide synthetase [Actinokineospora diospyrosa]|uniref:Amino acid adenylation domain-containing protein n=1 Tax=Actinokineospora diospyrosa TaxID=103728 RepID=A0ABT1IN96_9PSEU|nr:amino acid adenylation domain-containing protein [Actinokineospora diospyrosa]MCP2273936.1 amino acid adenylation domain-containing protein [Actinokineospora diospyrosa]